MDQFDTNFFDTPSDNVEQSLQDVQPSLDSHQNPLDLYPAMELELSLGDLSNFNFEESYDEAEHEKLQSLDLQQPYVNLGEDYVGRYEAPEVIAAHFSASSYTSQEQAAPPMPYLDQAVIQSSLLSSSQAYHPEQVSLPRTPNNSSFDAKPGQERRYRNSILNHFRRPSLALSTIDEHQNPFEPALTSALKKVCDLEVQRERAARMNNIVGPYAAPVIESTPVVRKKAGNKRSENIANFKSSDYYEPLAAPPECWGPINPQNGEKLFQYTKEGELIPDHTFTTDQIRHYIAHHPLHKGTHPKKSGLVFWIQTTPSDSSKRYPDKNSDKCRFADCPDQNRTIRKGEFRIMFDERYAGKKHCDPFHNAGYVHLFCMEKFIDFPDMCKNFRVKADSREHVKKEKNRMAITRDYPEMEDVVRDFVANSQPWNGHRPTDYYEQTLCSKLTEYYLSKQSRTRQTVREARGGNNITVHRNNLDVKVQNDNQIKAIKVAEKGRGRAAPKPQPNPSGTRKRKSPAVNEEESILDEHILDRSFPSSSTRNRRVADPRKKRRVSRDSLESLFSEESLPLTPSKKRSRNTQDSVHGPPPKLRRSPRSSRNNSWADAFHTSGLPY